MSCPYRKPQGSGYEKPTDAALAAKNESALQALLAARAIQEAKWQGAYLVKEGCQGTDSKNLPTAGTKSALTANRDAAR